MHIAITKVYESLLFFLNCRCRLPICSNEVFFMRFYPEENGENKMERGKEREKSVTLQAAGNERIRYTMHAC